MDLESLSISSDDGPRTPTTTIADLCQEIVQDKTVADVQEVAGQRDGAILIVKRTPAEFDADSPKVGEIVKIWSHFDTGCNVEVLRTGRKVSVRWEIFFPLSPRGKCSCTEGNCCCELAYPAGHLTSAESNLILPPGRYTRSEYPPGVANPNTLAGQLPGAILVVQQFPWKINEFSDCPVEVGDYVELLHGNTNAPCVVYSKKSGAGVVGSRVSAKNLRTGAVGGMLWRSFFPLTDREVCDCFRTEKCRCRCVYTDFEKSVAFVKGGLDKY
ncbi:hypothetical protein BUE80_DR005296 [Diplocarpon rosae]|nr:hypothetical protein BUE80_DR005296 [Diplocarpon rosae]